MVHVPKVYLAGPDAFLSDAQAIGRRKREICALYGFEGLFPLYADPHAIQDEAQLFIANCRLIHGADIGLFNLTPYRGPCAHAGTVLELGLMFAQGKPVYGYSSATEEYRDQVMWEDRQTEDAGLSDNLMIARAIAQAGRFICLPEYADHALPAFNAFEQALAELKQAQLLHP